ncbi:helix-turn-helix domain-containing protein [Pseudonocardia sp. ICBG1034]|uniref:helix-turn-helix domain-containing protein n=1 Tax=Pseudonocardia sp. ICBG1034 TaxID=2844381 RepID=UPI001CCD4F0F|nr:helix-turn-helix domain-containing protein [Pseudonocardia sp. ICBG1034]
MDDPRIADPVAQEIARNRDRQSAIYGEPLDERIRRLTTGLGITQARLAAAIGLSPAMLSQLAGGRRVKIGDPAVLGRMTALDRRLAHGPVPDAERDVLLARVRREPTPWGPTGACRCAEQTPATGPAVPRPRRAPAEPTAEDALRGVSAPARLVAAAAELAPAFPEIAEVLRRAAAGRR